MNANPAIVNKLQSLAEQTSSALESAIIAKFSDRSMKYWNKMTPEEKQKLLVTAEDKINRHARIKKITFDKSLKRMKNVVIGTKPGETTITKTTPEVVIIEVPYSATYPDNTKQNPELQNFYLKDNAIAVSDDRKQKFAIMVSELKSLIPNNQTIKEIQIKAGSTTSQVPTKYKGGNYNSIEEGQKNNIALTIDRCAQIESVLNEIIKAQFPQYSGQIIVDKRDLKPNNGTPYTSKDRKYFFGTGKLDPNKKAEYDSMYGPYKGSYGSVMIIAEGKRQEDREASTEEQVPQTIYKISLGWKAPRTPLKKRSGRSKGGGGISVGGSKVLSNCPLW